MMTLKRKVEKAFNDGLKTKMAQFFEEMSKIYDLKSFFNIFINMSLFMQCFSNETVYSQSPKYIAELFHEQCTRIPQKRTMSENDIAYWIGYLISDWYLEQNFNPININEEVFDWLWYGYDTLHTQSTEYVYQLFLERFDKTITRSS